MAGTRKGGEAAAITNKKKYGADFYARVGAKGGSATGRAKGFGANAEGRERARIFGRMGGAMSRRGRKLTPEQRAAVKAAVLKDLGSQPEHQAIVSRYKQQQAREAARRKTLEEQATMSKLSILKRFGKGRGW